MNGKLIYWILAALFSLMTLFMGFLWQGSSGRFDRLEAYTARIAVAETKVNGIETRLDKIDASLDKIDAKLDLLRR